LIPTSATSPPVEPESEVDAARPPGGPGRRRLLPRSIGVRPVLLLAGVGVLLAAWDDALVPVLVSAGIWSTTAVGLGMVLGRAGQISLGQAAMVGLGAYTAMKASGEWGWPGEAVVVAGVVAGLVSAAIAAPVLRLRGLYLALATLAYGLIFERLVVALRSAWR
jgi:branched-chain amino acid transport system permease protein